MSDIAFKEFPKMGRLSREVIVTEKIDGTNACVCITEDGQFLTGSRTRWITPTDDNFGFSRWAHEHKEELITLGVGKHFGEWWGSGIQRGYGLKEKRFSLFNVARWVLHGQTPALIPNGNPKAEPKYQGVLPSCVGLVPVLGLGIGFGDVDAILSKLELHGSYAAPGFMKPEGIVAFHTAGQVGFKKTLGNDGAKGA